VFNRDRENKRLFVVSAVFAILQLESNKVLLASVCVEVKSANVEGPAGSVKVPPLPTTVGVLMVGDVRVLFVKVSLLTLPTSVSTPFGSES
jgi:hypothetical protein